MKFIRTDLLSHAATAPFFDEMSLEIIKRGSVTFVEEDIAALWEKAKSDGNVPYAFMYGDDDEKREKMFRETYEMRLSLYRQAAGAEGGRSR